MSKLVHQGPHKYGKRNIGSLKTYFVQHCHLARCKHYLSFNLAIGQESLCWKCNKPFIISARASRLAKPRCLNCKDVRKKEVLDINKDVLSNLLKNVVKIDG